MLRILPLLVVGILWSLPQGAYAQAGAAEDLDLMVSINPPALVGFGFVAMDFEQVITRGTTGGLSLFYARPDDRRYVPVFTANGVFRYYASGLSFDGFAVRTSIGLTVMDDDGASRNALGLGFGLEHHWLVGEQRRLGVAGGLGAQRLFYFSERGEASRMTPLLRLSLGWAF